MSNRIELLDCTLRDGAYVNGSMFGDSVIKGIIKKVSEANIEYVECGWLKNDVHKTDSTYFQVPSDSAQYLTCKKPGTVYVAMIDWDRYDTEFLPEYDGKTIDAVRIVFPRGKAKEGFEVGAKIRAKGYQVFIQAANTLGYSDDELLELVSIANNFKPAALSVVDTFGAMYHDDLEHIVKLLDSKLDPSIKLGFHSHNNQQLSFALTMHFAELLKDSERDVILDASLCGMGRGAGNTTTELIANYLNRKKHGNYDMNCILDAIDMYMGDIKQKFNWGYSTPYFIAGMYQCHVNNIAYLLKNHRTTSHDMHNIISALSAEERRHYDYDLLEKRYMENQGRIVDDEDNVNSFRNEFDGRKILLLAPGKSLEVENNKILEFIKAEKPVVIGINAINSGYQYDYLFFANSNRYEYAKNAHSGVFDKTKKLILSNIKNDSDVNESVFNFNDVVKRGWEHFDNGVICALRLMNKLNIKDVYIAGFDGFKGNLTDNYADVNLPPVTNLKKFDDLNDEIKDMFADIKSSTTNTMNICFITDSVFKK